MLSSLLTGLRHNREAFIELGFENGGSLPLPLGRVHNIEVF